MAFRLGGFSLGYDDGISGDSYDGDDDVDGDDDDLGDDDFSLGGPKRRPAKQSRARANIQRVQASNASRRIGALRKQEALMHKSMTALQPQEQTQILPFPKAEGGGAAVPASTINTVAARPQRPFQTQRFVWPSTSSAFFTILQFTVGQENMFVQAGEASAEIFSQTGVQVGLEGYVAWPGIDITLQVLNEDTLPHPVRASIIGASLV
jgi:hypothetical protein